MPLQAREFFTDANINANVDGRGGARATDPDTGINLRATFSPHAGHFLDLSGGILGDDRLTVGVDGGENFNLVTTIVIDGLKAQKLG